MEGTLAPPRQVSDTSVQYLDAYITRARDSEKAYEDSIDAYKDAPIFRSIKKWRLKRRVREKKKQLRQSNRSLRSHYDVRALHFAKHSGQ